MKSRSPAVLCYPFRRKHGKLLAAKRREFITLIGGVSAAWPHAARAQKAPTPVIGFLDSRSSDGMTSRLAAFRQGLKEVGLIEGENVTVIYRLASCARPAGLCQREVDPAFEVCD